MLAATSAFPTAASATPQACPLPVHDRYEAGDEVTIVGYTLGCLRPVVKASVTEDQPLSGYLLPDPCAELDARPTPGHDGTTCFAALALNVPNNGIPVGQFALQDTGNPPWGLRMSLSFRLPTDLPPGHYIVGICQDPCTNNLNDGSYGGPTPVYVGVDPPRDQRIVRTWPLDDPAIQDLPDEALLLGPDGVETTAAELRTAARNQDDRTVAGAPVPDSSATRRTDPQLAIWLTVGTLIAITWLAVTRLGPKRKQIRQKQ